MIRKRSQLCTTKKCYYYKRAHRNCGLFSCRHKPTAEQTDCGSCQLRIMPTADERTVGLRNCGAKKLRTFQLRSKETADLPTAEQRNCGSTNCRLRKLRMYQLRTKETEDLSWSRPRRRSPPQASCRARRQMVLRPARQRVRGCRPGPSCLTGCLAPRRSLGRRVAAWADVQGPQGHKAVSFAVACPPRNGPLRIGKLRRTDK